jgi:hypothetical protein
VNPKAPFDGVTLERVRELFSYDPDTGIFIVKKSTSNRSVVGSRAGSVVGGYRKISIDYFAYKASRLAWLVTYGVWPSGVVDHKNGITDDDRIVNLRDVTNTLNIQNQRRAQKGNKSGLLGVFKHKRVKGFCAAIMVNKKTTYLGSFSTAEQAHAAYVQAKRFLHKTCTI